MVRGWLKKVGIISKVEVIGGLLSRIDNFSSERYTADFDERLIFQKTIYLLQAFGLYIGIPFSWYLHGPYSTVLAKYGYDLTKRYEKICPIRFAHAASERRFKLFTEFLGPRSRDAKWLEVLASIHFLRNTYPKFSKRLIISLVLRKQRYLTIEECRDAWNYLVSHNLIVDRD